MGHACGKPREQRSSLLSSSIDISKIDKGELFKNSQFLCSDDLSQIIEYSQAQLKVNDDSYSAHLNLGICLFALGYTEAAESHLLKSRQMSKAYESSYILGLIYLNKNELKQAQQFLKHSISEVPMIFVYIRLGEVLLRRNKHEEARKYAKQGLLQFPNNSELLNVIGMSYMSQDLRKAKKYCAKAVSISPDFFKPYMNLADICKAEDLFGEAEEMYKKGIGKGNSTQKGFAQMMLSLLYFQTGKLSKAISYCKKSIQTNPNLEQIMKNKGFDLILNTDSLHTALDLIQSEDYEDCIKVLKALYKKDKHSIPVCFFLGHCYFSIENPLKSKHYFKKVIKLAKSRTITEVNSLLVQRSEEILSTQYSSFSEPARNNEERLTENNENEPVQVQEELLTQEGNYPNFQEAIKENEVLDEEVKAVKVEPSPPRLIQWPAKSNSLRRFASGADPEPDKNCLIF